MIMMEGLLGIGSGSTLLRDVFLRVLRFPLSLKTNILKLQFDQEWYTKNHYLEVLPQNRCLFIYLLFKHVKSNETMFRRFGDIMTPLSKE